MPRSALVAAWLVAMGWVSYRDVFQQHQPPQPRTIIRGSLLYGLLGVSAPLITDKVAAYLGWGVLAATVIHDMAAGGGPPAASDTNGQRLGGPGDGGFASPPQTLPAPGGGVPDSGSRPILPPVTVIPRRSGASRIYPI